MTITVHATPAPQGSKSFRGMSKKGHAIMTESSKGVRPWREAVVFAAIEKMGGAGAQKITGPVVLRVSFTLKRPKSAKKGSVPGSRPDLDKLLRSTGDALTSAGVIEDDSRIVVVQAEKVYEGTDNALAVPGAVIEVTAA